MTDVLEITLEQEKESLIEAFQSDNPDLYAQYREILSLDIFEQPVLVEISISTDGTSGKS
jgi:hypothetical protein